MKRKNAVNPATLTRRSLYEQSLELEADLRSSLPGRARKHLDAALNGDLEAACALVWAAPNSMRGELAVLFYLRGAPLAVQREVLGGAWTSDHEEVITSSGSRSRLRAMFKALKFPLPESIPDEVTVWRGANGFDIDHLGRTGISWTLSREVAEFFAKRIKYLGGGSTFIFKAVATRANILFYTDDREEAECVIFEVRNRQIIGDGPESKGSLVNSSAPVGILALPTPPQLAS